MSETVTIGVEGMTCDHCARRVERALSGVRGVQAVSVDRPGAIAKVTFDPSAVKVSALHEAVRKSGYTPKP